MTQKILVTGATGAVGGAVVQAFAGKEVNVVAATRDLSRPRPAWSDDVSWVELDLEDPVAHLEETLDGVYSVFLVAPPPTVLPREIELTNPMLTAARNAGVKRIVKLSSMWAAVKEDSPHRVTERVIENSGLGFTHLRPNIFFQNFNSSQAASIKNDNKIVNCAGDGRVSFIDIRDIAAVAVEALTDDEHEGAAYTITGDTPYSYEEVALAISQATGAHIDSVTLPEAEFRQVHIDAGWPEGLVEYLCTLYNAVSIGQREPTADTVLKVTGRPALDLDTYVSDYVSAWTA